MTDASGANRRSEPGAHGPARRGFRWPAEWEVHAATWITWPHNPETWPGRLEAVERAYVEIVRALEPRERVRINVADAPGEERARRLLRAGGVDPDGAIDFVPIETDDAWMRDCGPIFVVRAGGEHGEERERLALDFRFDSWGGKYPPWDRDDAVARRAADWLAIRSLRIESVLEGGAIDGDGAGTVLTTESCLLNPNRGPGRTREAMEALLSEQLGARAVLWLGDGIAGDDTDGHVDDLTRFVAPGAVVTVVEPDASDPNHEPLAANRERLRAMRDANGKPLAIAELPMPPPLRYRGDRLPASYANFLLANGVALVPVFDAPSDARALAVLRECLPGRDLAPIPARDLVIGLGAVHCLTQQEPA